MGIEEKEKERGGRDEGKIQRYQQHSETFLQIKSSKILINLKLSAILNRLWHASAMPGLRRLEVMKTAKWVPGNARTESVYKR